MGWEEGRRREFLGQFLEGHADEVLFFRGENLAIPAIGGGEKDVGDSYFFQLLADFYKQVAGENEVFFPVGSAG